MRSSCRKSLRSIHSFGDLRRDPPLDMYPISEDDFESREALGENALLRAFLFQLLSLAYTSQETRKYRQLINDVFVGEKVFQLGELNDHFMSDALYRKLVAAFLQQADFRGDFLETINFYPQIDEIMLSFLQRIVPVTLLMEDDYLIKVKNILHHLCKIFTVSLSCQGNAFVFDQNQSKVQILAQNRIIFTIPKERYSSLLAPIINNAYEIDDGISEKSNQDQEKWHKNKKKMQKTKINSKKDEQSWLQKSKDSNFTSSGEKQMVKSMSNSKFLDVSRYSRISTMSNGRSHGSLQRSRINSSSQKKQIIDAYYNHDEHFYKNSMCSGSPKNTASPLNFTTFPQRKQQNQCQIKQNWRQVYNYEQHHAVDLPHSPSVAGQSKLSQYDAMINSNMSDSKRSFGISRTSKYEDKSDEIINNVYRGYEQNSQQLKEQQEKTKMNATRGNFHFNHNVKSAFNNENGYYIYDGQKNKTNKVPLMDHNDKKDDSFEKYFTRSSLLLQLGEEYTEGVKNIKKEYKQKKMNSYGTSW